MTSLSHGDYVALFPGFPSSFPSLVPRSQPAFRRLYCSQASLPAFRRLQYNTSDGAGREAWERGASNRKLEGKPGNEVQATESWKGSLGTRLVIMDIMTSLSHMFWSSIPRRSQSELEVMAFDEELQSKLFHRKRSMWFLIVHSC